MDCKRKSSKICMERDKILIIYKIMCAEDNIIHYILNNLPPHSSQMHSR